MNSDNESKLSVTELRKAGRLEEAYQLAKSKIDERMNAVIVVVEIPDNTVTVIENGVDKKIEIKEDNSDPLIWEKRSLAWVLYDFIKLNNSTNQFDIFNKYLVELKDLLLPDTESILFDKLSYQIGKMCFALLKEQHIDTGKFNRLFNVIKNFHFIKPSEGYSFLFKGFHKAFKDSPQYIEFADWWNFENFMPADFQKATMPNGKEVMAEAEQAYIAYAKHLLPLHLDHGEVIFDREKAEAFLPKLDLIIEKYPMFQYPPYFKAKILLALGDMENMLSALLPFAKKKRNDFWVWDILSEAFTPGDSKILACYCKALSCKSPDEMLISLRQRMAALLISKKLYNEAKTEIELNEKARTDHGFKIPNVILNWQREDWYKNAISKKTNTDFYNEYAGEAEALLFTDIPEEPIFIEFINSDKKILTFIANEDKHGFFKYDRLNLKDIKIGETLMVRFQSGTNGELFKVYTAVKSDDAEFKKQFMKDVEGIIRKNTGKDFGFINDIFVHPSVMNRYKLSNGQQVKGVAIKSFNSERKMWGWKMKEIFADIK